MIPGGSLHGSHIAVPCYILQHWRIAMKLLGYSQLAFQRTSRWRWEDPGVPHLWQLLSRKQQVYLGYIDQFILISN